MRKRQSKQPLIRILILLTLTAALPLLSSATGVQALGSYRPEPEAARSGNIPVPAEANAIEKPTLPKADAEGPKQSPLPPLVHGADDRAAEERRLIKGLDKEEREPEPPAPDQSAVPKNGGFRWKPALKQSMLFLAIEHGFRFATEPGTRADLKGPFVRDWFESASNIRGWRDGDPFLVNYIGHAMQGAVTGFIQIQNDPLGIKPKPGFNRAYVRSRTRAFWWSAAYSTQFELGPLSESSLGNVGLRPTKASQHPQAFVDMVITPTVGTAWLVGEDTLDHYLIRRIENKTNNRVVRLLVRSFLNPGRSFANAMRGKYPWYRDDRKL